MSPNGPPQRFVRVITGYTYIYLNNICRLTEVRYASGTPKLDGYMAALHLDLIDGARRLGF